MRSLLFVPIVFLGLLPVACGDDAAVPASDASVPSSTTDGAPPPPEDASTDTSTAVDASARFAEADAIASAAFALEGAEAGAKGFTLTIYDRSHATVFKKAYGAFANDQRVAIASASKLVSGLVILRLVDKGKLSLDSTTGDVLGWTGPNAAIKLSHLLSFTSGLPKEADCTVRIAVSLATCVDEIRDLAAVAPPGTRYDYGSTHLQVAGRMAEVAEGKPWATLFQDELKAALGLPAEVAYFTAPRQSIGQQNPLIAGGMRASVDEYAKILGTVFAKGLAPNGTRIVSEALVDAQSKDPYPASIVAYSPMKAAAGLDYRYGLASWLECETPTQGCAQISSPGAFGFTPWLDRDAGYYAILGMEVERSGDVVSFAVGLEQKLKPAIRRAFGKP